MSKDDPLVKTKPKRRKLKITLVVIVILLIIARLILPYVVLHYANKTLAKMNGYYGRIKDIDIALYRGAYKINKIYLHKKDSVTNLETEFFDAEQIDLSIHWHALLDGKIVGELEFNEPTLRFIKDKTEPKQIQKDTNDFRKILDDFMPLKINRFEIFNGVIKYEDKTSNPKVDIEMNNTHIRAENLTNVKGASTLPSTVTASADIYEGSLNFDMKLDPLADDPTFDLNMQLENTHLPELNNFFKAYGKFDVSDGNFGLFLEIAAKGGQFSGYAKPIIKNLKVLGPEDKDKDLVHKLWEGIIAGVGFVFKNQKHDQIATKIPIEGNFGKTKVYTWRAILEIFLNAFVQALQPSLDNDVNLGTVGEPGGTGIKIKEANPEKKDKKDQEKNKEENKNPDQTNSAKEEKHEKKGLFNKLFKKKDKAKNDSTSK
jgi:hypothetical protein